MSPASAPSGLAVALFLSLAPHGGLPAQAWVDRTPNPDPDHLNGVAYDPHRLRAVMFSGRIVYEWDGLGWAQAGLVPATLVTHRTGPVFDRHSGQVVVIMDIGSFGNVRTMGWDGQMWHDRGPAPTWPCALAADPALDSLLLMDTAVTGTASWTWRNGGWQPLATNRPAGLRGLYAADPQRRRLVLVGERGTSHHGATWEWDGTAWRTWPLPSALRTNGGVVFASDALGYDESRGQMVLFDMAGRLTSLWDGSGWTVQSPTNVPQADDFHLVFDRSRGQLLMLGGQLQGRQWRWTGADWQVVQEAAPAPLQSAMDWVRLRTVRVTETGTWEGDGMGWQRVGAAPPLVMGSGFAHDGQGCVLFGGLSSWLQFPLPVNAETRRWDGSTWTLLSAAVAPPARYGHGLATDLNGGGVLLHGGFDARQQELRDTWRWNTGQWVQLTTPVAPPGGSTRMVAMLSGTGDIMAAKGVGQSIELWRWNGAWQPEAPPVPGMSPTSGFHMGYDPTTGAPVVLGRDATTGAGASAAWLPGRGWFALPPPWNDPLTFELDPVRGTLQAISRDRTSVLAIVPAGSETIGVGCGQPVPRLSHRGVPRIGTPGFAFTAVLPAAAPFLLVVDLQAAANPMPNGCTALVGNGTTAFTVALPSGLASVAAPIPADLALRGLLVHAQGWTMQGSALAGSAALRVRIGD